VCKAGLDEGKFFEGAGEAVVAGAGVGGGVVADFVVLAHHFFPAVDSLFHRGEGEVEGAFELEVFEEFEAGVDLRKAGVVPSGGRRRGVCCWAGGRG